MAVSKKRKFILNLNNYRNTHFYSLNAAKKVYKSTVMPQLVGRVLQTPICVQYVYYPKTKRKTDLGNVLSIHQKFFEDALTELGCIADDDYSLIPQSIYSFGAVDPLNPRVEITIVETI